MGIYDRDYYREPSRSFSVRAPQTIVVTIILINVVLWAANGLLTPDSRAITNALAVSEDVLWKPWLWWKFLTYGFAHAKSPMHILFNMLQLFFLGRIVEQVYGRGEFLRVYLTMLLVGSVVWAITSAVFLEPQYVVQNGVQLPVFPSLIGASGAVLGVVILFVLNFPQQTLTLFPIPIPVKAWVIGVALVVFNLAGASDQSPYAGNTAYGVHLTGMAFAFLYFHNRWNLGRLGGPLFSGEWLKRRPKLRIHDPEQETAELSKEVDRILEKIHQQGEDSLTRKERRTLENASREYQKRRQG